MSNLVPRRAKRRTGDGRAAALILEAFKKHGPMDSRAVADLPKLSRYAASTIPALLVVLRNRGLLRDTGRRIVGQGNHRIVYALVRGAKLWEDGERCLGCGRYLRATGPDGHYLPAGQRGRRI